MHYRGNMSFLYTFQFSLYQLTSLSTVLHSSAVINIRCPFFLSYHQYPLSFLPQLSSISAVLSSSAVIHLSCPFFLSCHPFKLSFSSSAIIHLSCPFFLGCYPFKLSFLPQLASISAVFPSSAVLLVCCSSFLTCHPYLLSLIPHPHPYPLSFVNCPPHMLSFLLPQSSKYVVLAFSAAVIHIRCLILIKLWTMYILKTCNQLQANTCTGSVGHPVFMSG